MLKGCFVAARLRSVADSKSQKDGEGRVVEGCIVVQHKMEAGISRESENEVWYIYI